jgi:hypothetical protein
MEVNQSGRRMTPFSVNFRPSEIRHKPEASAAPPTDAYSGNCDTLGIKGKGIEAGVLIRNRILSEVSPRY